MRRRILLLAVALGVAVADLSAQGQVFYGMPKVTKREVARDENSQIIVPIENRTDKAQKTTVQVTFMRKDACGSMVEQQLQKLFAKQVELAPKSRDTLRVDIVPWMLQSWRNGSKTSAPGHYDLFVGDAMTMGRTNSTHLVVEDRLTNPENGYGASYLNENPFKEALLPVPDTAIFKMDGYSLWCPSVIEAEGKFHLFCSRWAVTSDWPRSEIIRATSDSLFGPYEFEEVVLTPSKFPYEFGQSGLHNPKIIKVKDTYYLYFLALTGSKTGMAYSKSPAGPWTIVDHMPLQTNNPAICLDDDGSIYVLGKENLQAQGGGHFRSMPAFRAKDILGPYTPIENGTTRLPYNFEHEDPTLWRANGQYNVIITDWAGKITNEQKSVVYFTSQDGVNYRLYSPQAIWRTSDPVPVSYDNGRFIKDMDIMQVERPEVHINKRGEVDALLVGVIPPREKKVPGSFIMIRPIDNFVPKNTK